MGPRSSFLLHLSWRMDSEVQAGSEGVTRRQFFFMILSLLNWLSLATKKRCYLFHRHENEIEASREAPVLRCLLSWTIQVGAQSIAAPFLLNRHWPLSVLCLNSWDSRGVGIPGNLLYDFVHGMYPWKSTSQQRIDFIQYLACLSGCSHFSLVGVLLLIGTFITSQDIICELTVRFWELFPFNSLLF